MAGSSTPVSPVGSVTDAVTPNCSLELALVISVTIDEEPVTSVTLPTRPPSPVTGSLTDTPSPDPASTSTV